MQCLHIKTLENKVGDDAAQRYRIVLSDVRNYVQCMLATQANHVMHDGLLTRGSIVRVKKYQAQVLKGKKSVFFSDYPLRLVGVRALTGFVCSVC